MLRAILKTLMLCTWSFLPPTPKSTKVLLSATVCGLEAENSSSCPGSSTGFLEPSVQLSLPLQCSQGKDK